ncbi:MAG: terminase small subunit [Chloroflexi bacterium]|nr:terminase small subunit [Chloroflexota bacterium]
MESLHSAQEQASRLLSNVKVQAAIQERFEARRARVEIDQDFVLEGLRENYNRAMQATPVLDREGKETGEWRWNGSVANKALELLGRHLGMYTDKSMSLNYNVNVDGSVSTDYLVDALAKLTLDEFKNVFDMATHRHGLSALDHSDLRRLIEAIEHKKVRLAEDDWTIEPIPKSPALSACICLEQHAIAHSGSS